MEDLRINNSGFWAGVTRMGLDSAGFEYWKPNRA
jgi:hypothetical protein